MTLVRTYLNRIFSFGMFVVKTGSLFNRIYHPAAILMTLLDNEELGRRMFDVKSGSYAFETGGK